MAIRILSSENIKGQLNVKDTQDTVFDSGLSVTRSLTTQTGYINIVGGAFNFNAPASISTKFRSNGNELIRIESDGDFWLRQVGKKLYFQNSAGAAPYIKNSGEDASTTPYGRNLEFYTDSYKRIEIDYAGTTTFDSGSNNVVAVFKSTDTETQVNFVDSTGFASIRSRNDFRFYVGGSSLIRAMDIADDGNVGIGDASPQGKLEVSQNMSNGVASAFTSPHLRLSALNTTDSTGFVGMTFATSSANNYGFSWGALRTVSALGGMHLRYHGNSASGNDIFNIDYVGNVTIASTRYIRSNSSSGYLTIQGGATYPGGRIDMYGGSSASAGIEFMTGGAYSSPTLRLRIDGDTDNSYFTGNLGIGTTGPQALLDVSKNNSTIYDPTDDLGQRVGTATIHIANQTATTNTFGQLMYDSRSSGQGIARIVFLNGGSATVGIAFVTEHGDVKSEKMRISSDGKVGIGTDLPATKLDVTGTDNGDTVRVANTGTYGGTISFNQGSGHTNIGYVGSLRAFEGSGTGDNGIGLFSRNRISFYLNSASPAVTIATSGNVGIATTSPSEKLTIPGNYGVGLGYKTFYSSGGTVPAGIGPSYYLVATLNQLQGTTLSSKHQYKFFLTTTGTGTYNSSVYIVYANSNDTAWVVREVSRRGTTSNHPELTVSGTEARIYNDHPSAYGVLYRVETTNSGQANTAPDIFGSDYMWQRTEDRLTYSDGVVGIGDTNPTLATRLVVAGSSGSGNVCDIRTGTTANTNVGAIVFRNSASAYCGQITVNGATAVTSYLSASDYRLKEDLQDFKGLDLVSNIKVYDYKWKSADERTYGVVAHELQEVLPQAVDGNKDDEQMQGVDYSKIVPLLVKSIQELKAEIELLKNK